jgi:hypothetical protein
VTRKSFAAGAAATTVTVAVLLLTSAHASLTRTQKEVVAPGVTVTDDAVAPAIGLDVLPEAPVNHWNPIGVPDGLVAVTESFTELPIRIEPDAGWVVIVGPVQVMKLYAFVAVPVPAVVVAATFTRPAACTGVLTTTVVALVETIVALVPPKVTVALRRSVPVIVTVRPPAGVPKFGLTLVIAGAATPVPFRATPEGTSARSSRMAVFAPPVEGSKATFTVAEAPVPRVPETVLELITNCVLSVPVRRTKGLVRVRGDPDVLVIVTA